MFCNRKVIYTIISKSITHKHNQTPTKRDHQKNREKREEESQNRENKEEEEESQRWK